MQFYSIHTQNVNVDNVFFFVFNIFYSGLSFPAEMAAASLRCSRASRRLEARPFMVTARFKCIVRITCTFLRSFVYARCGKPEGGTDSVTVCQRWRKKKERHRVGESWIEEPEFCGEASRKKKKKSHLMQTNYKQARSFVCSYRFLQALGSKEQLEQCRWRRSAGCSSPRGHTVPNEHKQSLTPFQDVIREYLYQTNKNNDRENWFASQRDDHTLRSPSKAKQKDLDIGCVHKGPCQELHQAVIPARSCLSAYIATRSLHSVTLNRWYHGLYHSGLTWKIQWEQQ